MTTIITKKDTIPQNSKYYPPNKICCDVCCGTSFKNITKVHIKVLGEVDGDMQICNNHDYEDGIKQYCEQRGIGISHIIFI